MSLGIAYKKMLFIILQNHKLKQEQKEETAKIQSYLANIRKLQDEKSKEIESEKRVLVKQVEQLTIERGAFIEDNQRISQLIQSAGLRQYKNISPGDMVEHLVKEVEKTRVETSIAQVELDSKQSDLETTMHEASKKTNQLEKELLQCRELHDQQIKKLQLEKEKVEAAYHSLQEKEVSLRLESSELKKKVLQETDEIKGMLG